MCVSFVPCFVYKLLAVCLSTQLSVCLSPRLALRARAGMVAHTVAKRDELGICAQVSLRYEMPYLLSWVAYHTLLGFDRILLYLDDLKPLGAVDGRKQARI